MTEKICFQWNEFSDHVSCAFKSFWENNDFADVTLACEDDEEVEAHRGIQTPCSILNVQNEETDTEKVEILHQIALKASKNQN